MTSSKSSQDPTLCPRCGDKVDSTPEGWLATVCAPCQVILQRDCKAALEKHRKIVLVSLCVILSAIVLSIYLAQPMSILTTFLVLLLMTSWKRQEEKKILQSHFKASK
ncbi:MAG: hypothetical protein P1V97_22915 [Planctomycetota bacterium]|nr:hypothetical protein [Planctomycetota bacterium]